MGGILTVRRRTNGRIVIVVLSRAWVGIERECLFRVLSAKWNPLRSRVSAAAVISLSSSVVATYLTGASTEATSTSAAAAFFSICFEPDPESSIFPCYNANDA